MGRSTATNRTTVHTTRIDTMAPTAVSSIPLSCDKVEKGTSVEDVAPVENGASVLVDNGISPIVVGDWQ